MPVLRRAYSIVALLAVGLLTACVGGNGSSGSTGGAAPPSKPPVLNSMTLTVDAGPAAGAGGINHVYVTVKICEHASTSCANIDHVLVDTGSWGLRLAGSVLAANSVALGAETDSGNRTIQECAPFGGGKAWGPVALADVTLAGEIVSKLPVQIMDDTGVSAPPPATCGDASTLIKPVTGFDANGVLGVGVFAQDCGSACVSAATPMPVYYGCTSGSAGVCTAENVGLDAQVTNPVAMFAADNNGIIVSLPNLKNANGDATVQGTLIFGLGTQSNNALPVTGLSVLGTDASGDFTATYNGQSTVLRSWIDSGADAYLFDDPSIAVCPGPAFVGYYCPARAPLSLFTVNTGVGANDASSTVQFALQDPNTFAADAFAFIDLGEISGGGVRFVWGMPYFYGRSIYVGIEGRAAGSYTGPYFAY